jgi:hypothetical protein
MSGWPPGTCCANAEFAFLDNGLQVRELGLQDDSQTYLFFPYRAIQAVRYFYSRGDREAAISLWVHAHGTPGAGGLSFRWRFRCESAESGRAKYDELVRRLP